MAVASGENAYATLAAHGDEQVLIFDLEQLSGKDGMLRSLMLELGSSASPMAAGDRVLLSELAFFRTVDAAEQYRTEVLSRSAEESGETPEPGQSGCGAGLSSPWGLGLMLVSALPVIRRKSKKS